MQRKKQNNSAADASRASEDGVVPDFSFRCGEGESLAELNDVFAWGRDTIRL